MTNKPSPECIPAEIALDVSQLEAPEPMRQISMALQRLPGLCWLKVSHRREPFPLYNTLPESGFNYQTLTDPSGGFTITIWRICDGKPKHLN